MPETHHISSEQLTIERIEEIINGHYKIALSDEAKENIVRCRTYLDNKLKNSNELFYGINTGFGALANVKISHEQIEQLQQNAVMAHACGTGDEVSGDIVKIMLLLKIQSLSFGHSGIDVATVWRLVDFFNHDILPVVYEQGSLGASGDLAPLAHLSLPLIGKGEVYYKGAKMPTEELQAIFKWQPIRLKSKEGIALLNGTQFMSAYGVYLLLQSKKLIQQSNLIAATSLDAFDCHLEPFDKLVHNIRPHKGQVETAKHIREILKGSKIAAQEKKQVQDPYSFRCIPQVHGASLDVINYAENVFLTEINSTTDNPNIFPEEDKILSGGNFHGQTLAFALDFFAIALSELGSISERRIFQLLSGQRGLPLFLAKESGLNTGLMIPQYTAASLVSQNKQLCTPASVDSIVSSNGQEDHVSMGANAATKCLRVLKNVQTIYAIELLTASQALDFRRPLKSSDPIEKFIGDYRKVVSFNDTDRILQEDIKKTMEFLEK
jgi:histidine ammonia-lyase